MNAGFNPGEDVYIALDVAASELYENKKYNLSSEDKVLGFRRNDTVLNNPCGSIPNSVYRRWPT